MKILGYCETFTMKEEVKSLRNSRIKFWQRPKDSNVKEMEEICIPENAINQQTFEIWLKLPPTIKNDPLMAQFQIYSENHRK